MRSHICGEADSILIEGNLDRGMNVGGVEEVVCEYVEGEIDEVEVERLLSEEIDDETETENVNQEREKVIR